MRVALASAIACIVACDGERGRSQPVGQPLPVQISASSRDGGVTADAAPVRFVGVLTAAESVDIAPRVAGIIASVRVGVGDKVTQGQVVAEMDRAQLREELRAAEAALSAASAAYKKAVVNVEDAQRKLALEIKSVAAGVSPTQNLEEARLEVKRAEAAAAQERSAHAAQAARTQTARDHVDNTSLRAPFAGTVAMRFRDAGNRVEAGTSILRIIGHGSMRLRFAVPPQLAKSVAVGTRVTATVHTVTKPIEATVKQVSPGIDAASGMVIVEGELDGAADGLQAGLAATVRL